MKKVDSVFRWFFILENFFHFLKIFGFFLILSAIHIEKISLFPVFPVLAVFDGFEKC